MTRTIEGTHGYSAKVFLQSDGLAGWSLMNAGEVIDTNNDYRSFAAAQRAATDKLLRLSCKPN
jgi:hypothetical protein